MHSVRIVNAAVAHPPNVVTQAEAAQQIGALAGDTRRVAALARASRIQTRSVALPAPELAALEGIEDRNAIYHQVIPGIARRAAEAALGESARSEIGALVTSSCTGYSVPGWGVGLTQELGLPCDTARLPITESGCAGGVVALAHAANFVRTHQAVGTLVVAAELCSLSFHAGGSEGNVTATLIFGDGAGAAQLQPGEGRGLEIIDAMSMLLPGTQSALGFDLTGQGFYPVLTRELVTLLPPATLSAATRLLSRNALALDDLDACLLHPGGARILSGLERSLGLVRSQTHYSWESMAQFGNTSSAAIFDVIRRYLEGEPRGYSLVAAFGPGVSIELLLVRASC
jgi:alkylresorcinol/alkylpyrone synthase